MKKFVKENYVSYLFFITMKSTWEKQLEKEWICFVS